MLRAGVGCEGGGVLPSGRRTLGDRGTAPRRRGWRRVVRCRGRCVLDATVGPGGCSALRPRHSALVRHFGCAFENEGTVKRDRGADRGLNGAPAGFSCREPSGDGCRVGRRLEVATVETRRSGMPRLDREARSAASVSPSAVMDRSGPFALLVRFRIGQRRPVGGAGNRLLRGRSRSTRRSPCRSGRAPCRAWPRTRQRRRRRGCPHGSAPARRRGPRGSARRGSRLRASGGRRIFCSRRVRRSVFGACGNWRPGDRGTGGTISQASRRA